MVVRRAMDHAWRVLRDCGNRWISFVCCARFLRGRDGCLGFATKEGARIMDEQIKPHHWITSMGRMSRRKPPKHCQPVAYYDQRAIDTLRAEVEGLAALHAQYVLFLEDEKARAERAEAEANALRKDADRYRWLRDTQTTFGISAQYDDAGSAVLFLRFHGYGSIPDHVDVAIDAAKQGAE